MSTCMLYIHTRNMYPHMARELVLIPTHAQKHDRRMNMYIIIYTHHESLVYNHIARNNIVICT